MGSIIGNKLKMTLFGESHSSSVGVVLDNLPAGYKIDYEFIQKELNKRKARGNISTSRIEDDKFEIISGVFNDYTTGAPLTIIIKNSNVKSSDYEVIKNIPRPSHADYTAKVKYNNFNDYRGGGHFSGRLTAAIVAGSAICKMILKTMDVEIYHHIKSIGHIESNDLIDTEITDEIKVLLDSDFPVLNNDTKELFINQINEVKQQGNSIGGSVQVLIRGVEIGYGNPFFNSIESQISQAMFSVPGVKAIEFGKGIAISKQSGSDSNDNFSYQNQKVVTSTNNSGGINGGISNGNDIVFTLYLRPTPTITIRQESVNLQEKTNTEVEYQGRHDPCIVHRASHVISNLSAFTILDIILSGK